LYLRPGAIPFRKLPIVVLVMKLKVKAILLGLALIALLCAVPSAMASGHKESAWFSIHFQPDAVPVSDWTCLEPEGRYFTSLDTGELVKPLVQQESVSLFPWNFRGSDSAGGGGGGSLQDNDAAKSDGNYVTISKLNLLLQRTDATDVHNLQDKLFGVIRNMVCGLLLVFMSGFLLVFSGYFHDGRSNKSKAAIWGYILSLDLGFIVCATQGFWSQDRILNVTTSGVQHPELTMLTLVGCAWYTFLRSQSQNKSGLPS
jgi:hypothetical protein